MLDRKPKIAMLEIAMLYTNHVSIIIVSIISHREEKISSLGFFRQTRLEILELSKKLDISRRRHYFSESKWKL